jgi:glycosyltransferase EpsE
MPSVSIIIGAYNCESTIAAALESIKRQGYQDWECIICDDGSHDRTWEVISELASHDSRFVAIQNDKNEGLPVALNRCINVAKGEYLARQDADDLSIDTRLEEQTTFLDAHREVSVLGTYAELFSSDQKSWGILKAQESPYNKDWVKGSGVIHASTMMRKRDIVTVGGYDGRPSRIRVEDYDLWIRMINKGYQIATLPKILYRIHWNMSDYARKKRVHRWNELKVKWMALQITGVPPYYCVYLLKPVFAAMIPSKLMYFYHWLRFRGMCLIKDDVTTR